MRAKGLFITFYNDVLNVEDVEKHNIFNFTRRKYAIRCNSIKEQQDVAHNIVSMDGIKNVRYAYSVDISIFNVVEYKRFEMDNFFMWQKELPMTDKEVYEWCPHCECEVIIKADCSIRQICPTCGKPIIACSMCEKRNCTKCKFSH